MAHPLLGYHKHWNIYCEERQDKPGELRGQGSVSNLTVADQQVQPLANDASGDVYYLVDPTDIAGGASNRPGTSRAAAAMINLPATGALSAAPTSSSRPTQLVTVAAAATATAAERGPQESARADLRMLSAANITQLREIKNRHSCLAEITTSGKGRTKENIAAEFRQKLQAMLGE